MLISRVKFAKASAPPALDPKASREHMPRYDEGHFRGQVDRALTTLKQALHTTRHPTYAEDTDHTYDDKFGLVEFLTNVSLAAQFACLESIGLDAGKLAQLQALAHAGKQCTLRLTATERCTFLREVSRDVDSASKVVHESNGKMISLNNILKTSAKG